MRLINDKLSTLILLNTWSSFNHTQKIILARNLGKCTCRKKMAQNLIFLKINLITYKVFLKMS